MFISPLYLPPFFSSGSGPFRAVHAHSFQRAGHSAHRTLDAVKTSPKLILVDHTGKDGSRNRDGLSANALGGVSEAEDTDAIANIDAFTQIV